MIVAYVDTTSQSFAIGQVVGVLTLPLIAIVLLWRLTRSWRAPSTPAGGDPAATLREERRRCLIIVGLTALIAVGAGVQAVASYNPEPRASETVATSPVSDGQGGQAGPSRAVVLPDSFADFRLLTGEAAEQTEAALFAGRKRPEGMKFGYYDKDGDENLDLLVAVRSAEWDPKVRAEKATDSISQEFRNYFAGAKAHDVTRFEPGPYGGGLACGLSQGPDGDQAVCAWSDATTFGAVRIVQPTTLADAAKTTLTLRNTAMH
ncbi:hypothetical protein [Streptomyces sp. ISL-86]|uniref:hypothetical protein n=1 Tax=Streptomyces sp. ISL-86 TaxID=2819187 RepID=UPI001BE8A1BC|nr:hypothetical protein [Streptomyces sp. ISL-86]MBT2459999.1 hypothetical protein [Streptomyces sp. ISL-86]